MINKKHTGSYYTPKILSDFLTNHVLEKHLDIKKISVLEPSCGDGQFVSSLCRSFKSKNINNYSFELIDINSDELSRATQQIPISKSISVKAHHQDYLNYYLNNQNEKYSLIIGNPPYIGKKNMEEKQIQSCEEIHKKLESYSDKVEFNHNVKNIWPAFIHASIMSLKKTGVLCFVVPAEILQVKHTKELRSLIRSEFDRVEIFAFNELVFDGIQQDVVALIGVKGIKEEKERGFSFYQVDCLEDLKEPKFTEKHSNTHRTSLDKWTNYILSDKELNVIDELKSSYKPIISYCKKAEVGIVTAANNYFMLNDDELKRTSLYRVKSLIKKIIPKGYFLPNLANFTDKDFSKLKVDQKKVNFINFPDKPKEQLGKFANNYLIIGEEQQLHNRYKMLRRKHWYHIPSIWASEGLFVKRCHLYPKILVNNTEALVPDSFYRVVTSDKYCIKKLVFSFYNSLTFILAELEGRSYGGGVLELTPNEFKNLVIPYSDNISSAQFNTLDKMLRNGDEIEKILAYTNNVLFKGLDVNIEKLENIRKRLTNRRLKKKKIKHQSAEILYWDRVNQKNDQKRLSSNPKLDLQQSQ